MDWRFGNYDRSIFSYKKMIRKAILIVLLSGFSFVFAQNDFKEIEQGRKSQITASLKESTAKIKSFQTEFVQTRTVSVLSEPTFSKGVMFYKHPSAIRWEYSSPNKDIVIINKGKVKYKASESKNYVDAGFGKFSKELSAIMLSGINGMKILESNEYKQTFLQNEKQICIQLVPVKKIKNQIITCINFYFDKVNYSVVAIEILDGNGDKTFIEFANKKENILLSDEKFIVN